MSQVGQYAQAPIPPPIAIETLTGNTGGAVPPTGGTVNVIGSGVISVAGNPGTSTLTIAVDGTVASSFPADVGTAIPVLGALTIAGGTGINTAGAGSTVTVNLDAPVTIAHGGTASTSFNANGVVISGTLSTSPLTSLTLTDGQIVIGNTAGSPAAATLTNGAGITIINGANSITIASSITQGIVTLNGDTGSATGTTVTIAGGTGITTSATGSTLTVDLDTPVTVPNGGTGNTTFTAYSVICAGTTAAGAFQNVSGLGSAGQVLKSNGAGALPSWQTDAGSTVWSTQTTGTQAMSVFNGYIANGAGTITYTLPTTAAVGEVIELLNIGAGFPTITYTTGQSIRIGNQVTTITSGSLTSTATGDSLRLICTVANTTFQVVSSIGNWTYA